MTLLQKTHEHTRTDNIGVVLFAGFVIFLLALIRDILITINNYNRRANCSMHKLLKPQLHLRSRLKAVR